MWNDRKLVQPSRLAETLKVDMFSVVAFVCGKDTDDYLIVYEDVDVCLCVC